MATARRKDTQPPEPSEAPLVLGEFLPYRISVAAEAVSALFASRYEERFGLTIPEWRVMAVVGEHQQQSTQQVIERTGMDRVRVSRAVIRLGDKGLLDRVTHPRDQRAQLLHLTRKGQGVYDQIVPLAREMQAALASTLSVAERETFENLLTKIGHEAKRLLAEGQGE